MEVDRKKKLEDIRKEEAEQRRLKRKKLAEDDQLSKRLKLVHEDIVDELRNYFRVVDFENKKIDDSRSPR